MIKSDIMAYDSKFRKRVIAYKDSGHTFTEVEGSGLPYEAYRNYVSVWVTARRAHRGNFVSAMCYTNGKSNLILRDVLYITTPKNTKARF
jgi:hypothetical protein